MTHSDGRVNANTPLGPNSLRPRWPNGVTALQVLVMVAAVAHSHIVHYVADDGFISFRYADHFAHGQGLVFNLGERVEGYTNFLWVLLLGLAQWAVPSASLPQVASAAGTLAAVLTIALAFRLSAQLALEPAVGLLVGACLAAHASLAAWSPAGLETSLFALLCFAAVGSYAGSLKTGRGSTAAGLMLALASLTRPDGVIFFVTTWIALVVIEARQRKLGQTVRLVAGFAAIYLPYFLWRYAYYGDLFPNTAYAKVGFGLWQLARGEQYLWDYVVQYGVLLWVLPVLLYFWRQREAWVWYFGGVTVTYLLYVVYVGGDGLAFHRFVAHVAPLMYFVVAAALVDGYRRYVIPRANRAMAAAGAAVFVVALLALTSRATLIPVYFPDRARWFEPQSRLSFPGTGRDHSYVWFDNYFVDRLAAAAQYLERHAPPDSLVAATPAGSIGYHMHHRLIDMLGLTDKHIARTPGFFRGRRRYGRAGHEKGDGAYVLSRAPDYILMGNVAVFPRPLDEATMARKLVLKSEHELWDNPEFHAQYQLVNVRIADEGLFQYFSFYQRKSSAATQAAPALRAE